MLLYNLYEMYIVHFLHAFPNVYRPLKTEIFLQGQGSDGEMYEDINEIR